MLEVDPVAMGSSGINENRLQDAIGLVAEWVGAGIVPGASLMIARGDHLVAEGYWGWADARTKRPAARHTLWSIASIGGDRRHDYAPGHAVSPQTAEHG